MTANAASSQAELDARAASYDPDEWQPAPDLERGHRRHRDTGEVAYSAAWLDDR